MSVLLALPIVVPLIGAALSIVFGRSRATQRAISVSILLMIVVVSIVLLVHVDHHGPVSMQAGGWPAPMGITLIADRLSAIMLVAGSVMLLAVLIYAIGEPGAERNHVGFQSVYLVLTAGVALSLLTGDLFTLFVAFEMMLTASYVLLTLGGRRQQVRSGMPARSYAPRICVIACSGRSACGGRECGYSPIGRPTASAARLNASPQCVK